MKTMLRYHGGAVCLIVVLYALTAGISIASFFEECELDVRVLNVEAGLNTSGIKGLTVKVVSLNNAIKNSCPYSTDQTVAVRDPEIVDGQLSAIRAGVQLRLHYTHYSGLGESGVTVGGEKWRILEIVSN